MTARLLDPLAPGFALVLVAVISGYLVARATRQSKELTWLGEGMRWVGVRSYGVYLIHPTLLATAGWGLAANYGFPVALAAGGCASLGFAAWLYQKVEQPARRRLSAICEIALMPKQEGDRNELEAAR